MHLNLPHTEKTLFENGGVLITQQDEHLHLWFTAADGRRSLQGSCHANPDLSKRPLLNYIAWMLEALKSLADAQTTAPMNSTDPTDIAFHAWVLGLGTGSIAHGILDLVPNAQLSLVEINPSVIKAAQQYFHCPSSHSQWRYHIADIRDWLTHESTAKQVKPRFIALDIFDAETLGPAFGMRSEYALIARRLHPQGCMAVNLHEQYGLAAHLAALNEAFEGRVRVNYVANRGNPIAFCYGPSCHIATRH